jgi:hypothetical protein
MKPFEPSGATQVSAAMDGTAKTITIDRVSDVDGSVNIVVIGTATVFIRLDGVTPTITNAKPLLANSDQTFTMPSGATTVKMIGAAGSTCYVTRGRGN